VTGTVDIGSNLTAVLIALIAAVPAIIAAFYARKASNTSTATSSQVDGRMTEMLAAKDHLISAANAATAYAQGQNAAPTNTVTNGTTLPKG
jgi:hypothetical protein